MSNQLAPGMRRGMWTLEVFTPGNSKATPRIRPTWLCVCDCGTTRRVRSDFLTAGSSRSCGCTVAAIHSKEIGAAFAGINPLRRRPGL